MVMGQGLLGLFATQFLRLSGANPVVAADLGEHRRALALQLGADYAFDPSTNRIYLIGDGGFVAYVENRSLQAAPNVGDVFFDYAGRWKEENIAWTTVAHLQANYPRTYSRLHNNCIIRDAYGYIPDGKRLEFAVTGALPDGGYKQIFPAATQHIWTYRILRKTLDIG